MIRILKASKQTDGMEIAEIGEKMSKTQMSVFIDENVSVMSVMKMSVMKMSVMMERRTLYNCKNL